MDTGKIRLAEQPPSHCSSCFMQMPEKRHVDFNVAWDGPTFPGGVAGGLLASIDEMIVCEDCLRVAAEKIGMSDAEQLKFRLQTAQAELADLRERLTGQADYIERLEKAAESRDRLSVQVGKVQAVREQAPRKRAKATA